MKARHKLKGFSLRRLKALCIKEIYEIYRDPSSILVAFVLPIAMLFIYGYAVNLDASRIHIGILIEDTGPAAVSFQQSLLASNAYDVQMLTSRVELMNKMRSGNIRGAIIVQNDFSAKVLQGHGEAAIQVLADGSEPNIAQFVGLYAQGIWRQWQENMPLNSLVKTDPTTQQQVAPVNVIVRTWFNPSTISRNFLVPGSIAVVMTIIGALLTSLVVAREWERGTMEALLATPVTRAELLLSKILPYYFLGMFTMMLCVLVTIFIIGIPFRGSFIVLLGTSSLFMLTALGFGLFISTKTRMQFEAAQAALMGAFLPALMLSGFVFEISSMPKVLQWITNFIPARYFVNSLQTLFQAGNIPSVLWPNAFFLFLLAVLWLGNTARITRRTLD